MDGEHSLGGNQSGGEPCACGTLWNGGAERLHVLPHGAQWRITCKIAATCDARGTRRGRSYARLHYMPHWWGEYFPGCAKRVRGICKSWTSIPPGGQYP